MSSPAAASVKETVAPARSAARVVVPLGARQKLLGLVDLLIVNLSLLASLRYSAELPFAWSTVADHWYWFAVLSVLWLVIATAGDNYNSWRSVTPMIAVLGIAKALALTMLIYMLIPLLSPPLPATRTVLLQQIGLTAGFLVLWRLAFALVFRRSTFRRRTIIVGAGQAGRRIGEALVAREPSHDVLGFVDDNHAKVGERVNDLPVLGGSPDLVRLVEQTGATDLVIAIIHHMPAEVVREMLRCYERGVRVLPMPALYEQVTGRVPVEHIGDRWLVALPIDRDAHTLYAPVKRAMDVAVSLVGLLLLAPFFPFLALAIKLDSPGPVFYRPQRLGKGGRPFGLWKLRTMVPNADRIGDPTFTAKADDRVTRVGRLLRAAHLDELPQFINILSGEMSLVGPRPERYVKELEEQIPFYRMRLAVRPGTAGWALVKQGYAEGTEGTLIKLQYDLFYIKHMSLYLDVVIIVRTAIDMLFRRGQ
jgi:exopolysaccharide biosynthesis polyprenyl glycosylphosphotransferase